MSDNKKYYYLKLKDDFYASEDIRVLEAMPNGYEYSSFYLKLCLMSLKEEGRLLFKGRIPYKPELLASITGHNIDTVRVALELFQQLEMISLLDSGTMFINDIQTLIGRGSSEAERKQEYRKRINNEKQVLIPEAGHCPDVCPPEIEIRVRDKEKDLSDFQSNGGDDLPKKAAPKKQDESFDKFWNLYDKKDGKKKCEAKWKKLPTRHRELIFTTLSAYLLSTPDRQYRKNPLTYLNGECWNDELASNSKPQTQNMGFNTPFVPKG